MENPVLELKTKIEIENSIKLIDINGKKINFKSECLLKPNNPNDQFYVSILNQNELDTGNYNFEVFTGNVFKRLVTYESEDNEHLNHYIAVKKIDSKTDKPIKCDVIIRLTELKQPGEKVEKVELSPSLSPSDKEELTNQVYELSLSDDYQDNSFYKNMGIFCIIVFVVFMIIRKV